MKNDKDIIGSKIEDWNDADKNLSENIVVNNKITETIELIHQGGGPVRIQKHCRDTTYPGLTSQYLLY